MATIFSFTDATIPKGKSESDLIDALGEAVRVGLGLAPQFKSVYNFILDPVHTTDKPKPEITLFIYTAPDKTTEQKRTVVQNVKEAVDEVFGTDAVNVVVIFKIHEDENVGVNGVLRLDAKAAAAEDAASAAAEAAEAAEN